MRLVDQDLNADGKPEQVLYAFGDGESLVLCQKEDKWELIASGQLPAEFNKDKLLQAVANHQLDSAPEFGVISPLMAPDCRLIITTSERVADSVLMDGGANAYPVDDSGPDRQW